jgi:DNA-binding transcriptional LysR family regulator
MALLKQLRYFVAVAEERHFGRAADRLGIAQPGLSQQIKVLERVVGVPLFIRDKRSVEMTEAGARLLDDAMLIVELADRALQTARRAAEGKRGVLKVGTRALGGHPLADEVIREFGIRHPEVILELHPGFVADTIKALARRRIDIAIVVAPISPPTGASYMRVGVLEPVVALPLGHRLAALERIPRERLLNEAFLGWPHHFSPDVMEPVRDVVFGDDAPRNWIEVTDLSDTTRLARVAAGEGLTIVVRSDVTDLAIENVVFRRLADPVPVFDCGLTWFDDAPTRFVRPFIDLAHELVAKRGPIEHAVDGVERVTKAAT